MGRLSASMIDSAHPYVLLGVWFAAIPLGRKKNAADMRRESVLVVEMASGIRHRDA